MLLVLWHRHLLVHIVVPLHFGPNCRTLQRGLCATAHQLVELEVMLLAAEKWCLSAPSKIINLQSHYKIQQFFEIYVSTFRQMKCLLTLCIYSHLVAWACLPLSSRALSGALEQFCPDAVLYYLLLFFFTLGCKDPEG